MVPRVRKPPGEGPCKASVSVPEPSTHGPAPPARPRHGVLCAPVLLLHLRLRVHQQRATDGAHEGARGRHHQHHPEQRAAAVRSTSKPPNSRVTHALSPLPILTLTPTLCFHKLFMRFLSVSEAAAEETIYCITVVQSFQWRYSDWFGCCIKRLRS